MSTFNPDDLHAYQCSLCSFVFQGYALLHSDDTREEKEPLKRNLDLTKNKKNFSVLQRDFLCLIINC